MTGTPATAADLVLPDAAALADLETFVGRARQIDPSGVMRLVAHGSMLAVYAAALHGAGAPTVLAMRVVTLDEPSGVDTTVPVAALADRFARIARTERAPGTRALVTGDPIRLPLPPDTPTAASWTGLMPPRTGWSVEGVLRVADLRRAARAGIEEVAAGTPAVAGAAAVSKLRATIWGRPLPGSPELPSGAAFAAEAFGFLGSSRSTGGIDAAEVFDQDVEQDAVTVHRVGPWRRLSGLRGHVLARTTVSLV